ncbi:prefoldin, chaperonin cofactor [Cenarchaeum symbiosum A]|uniref:Prefoldin subunit beta n=1 Tax=Cenarchaeum symbiosum (strain A) TaxID=414004 RepID=A0RTJ8_CENSY|nr:prefoldin, chaperonin cofactor [Cenarchaeum symbiosum A]
MELFKQVDRASAPDNPYSDRRFTEFHVPSPYQRYKKTGYSTYSMSAGQQVPPWLQEQIMKLQQTQQSLQSLQVQRQQLDMEKNETDKALEELEKTPEDGTVYKHAGSVLIKSNKVDMMADLKERKELADTRAKVLEKQVQRVNESLKEQETKINEMIKGGGPGGAPPPPPTL